MLLVRCSYDLVCSFGLKAYTVPFVEILQKVYHDISAVWLLLLLATFNTRYVSCLFHSAQAARTCLYFEIRLKRYTHNISLEHVQLATL